MFRIEYAGAWFGLLISVRDHTPMRAGKYPPFKNKFATGTASGLEANRFVAAVFQ
jgi:hypothetical protein